MLILLYCFHRIYVCKKTLLDYTNFIRMTIERITKKYISILKINMVEVASLEFRLTTINETKNYLLDEIKYNDLISKKHKNTC